MAERWSVRSFNDREFAKRISLLANETESSNWDPVDLCNLMNSPLLEKSKKNHTCVIYLYNSVYVRVHGTQYYMYCTIKMSAFN